VKVHTKMRPATASEEPSKRAADFAIKKLEKSHGRLKPNVIVLIRKACGVAYGDAQQGGKGGWFDVSEGSHMVRANMRTVDEWEVEVYSKIA